MIVGAEGQYLRYNVGVTDLMDGEWHTIAAQYDGIPDANDKIWIRYFKDGAFWTEQSWDATAPVHVAVSGPAHGDDFYIGTDWSDPPRNNLNYIGSIDEVSISNTLSQEVEPTCGDWGYLDGDINKDCYANLSDYAELAEDWMECIPDLPGDIVDEGDNCVNVGDLSEFVSQWLMCTDPCDPVNCIQSPDDVLVFENEHYICQLNIGNSPGDSNGLKWGRIFNKDCDANYLYSDNSKPVFIVIAESQVLDSTDFIVNDVSVTQQGNTKSWQLLLSCPSYSLEAVMDVEVDDTEKMLWSLSIKNTAGYERKLQPVFPIISRIKIGNSLEDNKYFYPFEGGLVGDVTCKISCDYGSTAFMQVMSVFNPVLGAGLYVYPMDETGGFKGMVFRKLISGSATVNRDYYALLSLEKPSVNGLEDITEGIGLTYYYPELEIAGGAEYLLPETVISVSQSGWKEALSDYSSWAHTWYSHVNTPQWYKNCFAYGGMHPPAFYSEAQGRYVGSEALTGGEHAFQYAYWWDYNDQPSVPESRIMEKYQHGDYYYHEGRGGLTAFKDEIEAIQEKGTRFIPYTDYQFAWQLTDIGDANGQDWARMNPPGQYSTYGSANPDEIWLECFYEPNAWANWYADTCARIVHDTNIDGIYLDELFRLEACYNPSHVHYQQDKFPVSANRMAQLTTNLRNLVLAENPEAIVQVEHIGSDYFSQFVDGSWDETFAASWVGEYYDENRLTYFRFCFPELKLGGWGYDSEKGMRRNFFNGICIVSISEYAIKAGSVLRENGDAFASLNPEPIVETKVSQVLANKFPTLTKVAYTFYNKNTFEVNEAIINVEHKTDYHYVDLLYDNEVNAVLTDGNDELTFAIDGNEVVCVAQLPEILQITEGANDILTISLAEPAPNSVLAAWLNLDTSEYGLKYAEIIELVGGQAQINVEELFGQNGKLILKLYQGEILLDEALYGEYIPYPPGTLVLWHMDEGSGQFAYNAAGPGSTLTLGSNYFWTSGQYGFGESLFVPADTDSWCYSTVPSDAITTQVTIEAWIRPIECDSLGSVIVSLYAGFMLEFTSIDAIRMVTYSGATWPAAYAQATWLFDNDWHHVAGVFDGIPDDNDKVHVYLYLDDILFSSTAIDSNVPVPVGYFDSSTGVNLCVGSSAWWPDRGAENYYGGIDEIELSNMVKTFP